MGAKYKNFFKNLYKMFDKSFVVWYYVKAVERQTTKYLLIYGGVAQLARAPALQAGGQEFDSPHLHHYMGS